MIVPQSGYILIEPEKAKDVTSGGIYVPQNGHEIPQIGKVVEVGNPPVEIMRLFVEQLKLNQSAIGGNSDGGTTGFQLNLPKKGDRVYYRKWGGDEIKDDDGKEFKIVKFDDILAVVR